MKTCKTKGCNILTDNNRRRCTKCEFIYQYRNTKPDSKERKELVKFANW